ncbi:MAG: beta-galactosidase [Clostridia bacterium]|nr:beta-galactosidase [Clostridia bacterium]
MERLIKTGKIQPKDSLHIKKSRIGLGFEKLDRNVFDPEKAYDKVAEIGVKWARIQSGWQRTEKQKGVYDFEWIDSIIDNFLKRGIRPWVCLCYGNELYDDLAKTVFGAVGCPPIFSEEQKKAWSNYVKAFAKRYKGKITHYEVWNEPDGQWCWKTGVNATQLGEFTTATAKAVKEADSDAKVIGGVICDYKLAFLNEAFAAGMGEYIDYISFHEYTADETKVFEKVKALKALAQRYNPNIQIIQGESGSQSKSGGHGALRVGAWTEAKQAKQLLRHTVADLLTDVYFTSYFSCVDMIEALNGEAGNIASYLDYGYFGVLGAEFDSDGRSAGNYYKKPSYYALQNIASVFAEDYELCEIAAMFVPHESERIFGADLKRNNVVTGGFSRQNGEAFVYWYPSDIMTTSYEGTISMEVYSKYDKVQLVDLSDGSIYDIPSSIITRDDFGVFSIKNLPVKDTPMLLTFGEFIK